MPKIIGFEGGSNKEAPVTYGAAAILEDGQIINAISGARMPAAAMKAKSGVPGLSVLPEPLSIEAWQPGLMVMRFRIPREKEKALWAPLTQGVISTVTHDQFTYSAFKSLEDLEIQARKVIDKMLAVVMEEEWGNLAACDARLSLMLTLDYTHPTLNAVWAYRHKDRPFIERLARAQVVDSERDEFQEVLDACRDSEVAEADVGYSGGEADNGGFSLPISGAILNSLDNVYGFEVMQSASNFHWFPRETVGSVDLIARRAASVHLIFSLHKDGDSFRTRLGRSMVLRRIRRVCRTGAPGTRNQAVVDAYRTLIQPVPDAQMTISLGAVEDRAHSVPPARFDAIWFKKLSMSDVQILQKGRPVPYLRLTASGHPIDYLTWFREEMFEKLKWRPSTFGKHKVEEAKTKFFVSIQGIPLGEMKLMLTHGPTRAKPNSHGHPTTWIHWNESILSIFRSGFYVDHWVTLARQGDRYTLTISASPPGKIAAT